MAKGMKPIDWVALVLVVVGAINWGLVGAFGWNLVEKIAGVGSIVARIIYDVIGIAGLYSIYALYKARK